MLIIVYILLLYIYKSHSDCVIDNRSQENIMEQNLHKDLLKCGYLTSESPNPNGTVNVDVSFTLKSFNFNSDEEYLTANSWVYMSWIDTRLKWNASDYDGIKSTMVMSFNLWLPGLRLINIAYGNDYDMYFFSPCKLWRKGKIFCLLKTKYEARCSTTLTYWPYDIQKCYLVFGAWGREGTKVVFKLSDEITIPILTQSDRWQVVDYEQKSDINSETQLKLIFTLKREAKSLAAIIIYPSLILVVLNIASMALDISSNMRLGMLCFNLASHFLFIPELNFHVPKNSVDAPIILLYYRGSLIITLTLILFTYLLGVLSKRNDSKLTVSILNDAVLRGRLRYFVLPHWNCDASKDTKEWSKFTNIVNSFCIILITVIYIGLFITLLPREANFDPRI